MIRLLTVAATAIAMGSAFLSPAAGAQPDAPPCHYTLTPPQVVSVSGTAMVTSTMTPADCNGAIPYLQVVCLQLAGSQGPGECRENRGLLTAQVYHSPFTPGTYVATGRGCASFGNPPQEACMATGPLTATL